MTPTLSTPFTSFSRDSPCGRSPPYDSVRSADLARENITYPPVDSMRPPVDSTLSDGEHPTCILPTALGWRRGICGRSHDRTRRVSYPVSLSQSSSVVSLCSLDAPLSSE